MALDRYNERSGEGLSQMVARKQYNRAIEVLRTRLKERPPDPRTRLRLADLLVQAGRGQEAIPILLALADDFGNGGFVAKAVAVLKRVEKIRPNLAEVNRRLDGLALQPELALAVPSSVLEAEPAAPFESARSAQGAGTPVPPAPEPEEQQPAAPNETVVLRIRGLLGRLLGSREESPTPPRGSPEATRPGEPPQPSALEGDAELDASAFLPRSFTPIPPAPASPGEQQEELPEPSSPSQEVSGAPVAPVVPPEATPAPEVAAAAEAPPESPQPPASEVSAEADATTTVAEPPPPPEPSEPEPPPATTAATSDPAPENRPPEGRGLRSFLGRLWGRRREEATPPAPVWTVFPAAEPASPVEAEEPFTLASSPPLATPEVQASVSVVESETPPAATPPEAVAEEPRTAAEPLPMLEPDPEPVAAVAESPLSETDFHERLLDVVQEALVRQSPEATEPIDSAPAIDTRRLRSSPLLVELDDAELRQLVRDLQLRTCEPGDIVLSEGEPGETLFLLVSGTVKVFVRNPSSRNVEVHELGEGDFFGEVGFLSGRPRMATVVAATALELLELERPALERLARVHPGMLDMLEAYYLARTQSDAAATLRSAAIDDPDVPRRAAEVLKAHFGEAQWDPRIRLKLAEALLKSGKQQEALPILAGLADELVRAGYTEKAVAILKRIERIEGRHTEQFSLAPLKRAATPAPPAPTPAAPRAESEGGFNGWLLELVRKSVERVQTRRGPASAPGLLMSPLFEGFSDEELLALVRGLRLLEYDPGDVVISEGEQGDSVFVLTAGLVKVFVRNTLGHNVLVGRLGEGDFFGEISLLSGRPRSATITSASACELLELDKPTLERVCAEHPRVRSVMEDVYIERASHPLAARVRASAGSPDAGP
jgi:CRP-like cAMP-binding protein